MNVHSQISALVCSVVSWPASLSFANNVRLVDTHIHYSHDAWVSAPTKKAINILREAGLANPWVSCWVNPTIHPNGASTAVCGS